MMKKLDDRIFIIDNVLDKTSLEGIQNIIYDTDDWKFGQTNPPLEKGGYRMHKKDLINEEGLLRFDIERAWYRKFEGCNAPVHFWRKEFFEDTDYHLGYSGGEQWNKWKDTNKDSKIVSIEKTIRNNSEGVLTNFEPTSI